MGWHALLISGLVVLAALPLFSPAAIGTVGPTPSSDALSCPNVTSAAPSWMTSCDQIDFENYSLPNLGLGFRVVKDDYNDPIVTTNLSNPDLMAYYLNISGALAQYNLNTSTYSVIEPGWLNLTAWNAPQTLFPYIDPAGEVVMLYTTGEWPSGGMGAEEYWLTNHTFAVNHNSTIPSLFVGTDDAEVSASVCDLQGDIAFGSRGPIGTIYVLNIWSPSGSVESQAFDDGFVGWNSWDYYPTVNTVVENENVNVSESGGEAALWIFQFDDTTHTLSQRVVVSETIPFLTGDDLNNQAYFYEELPNGTTLGWGIATNDGSYTSDATYHVERFWLYSNIDRDTWESVESTGSLGTTDEISGAIPDSGGFYLNGFNMGIDNSSSAEPAPNGAADHQSLFVDPLDLDEVYANNSAWLNQYITSADLGYNAADYPNDTSSSFEFVGPNDTTGAFLQPGGSTLTVYWLVGAPTAPEISVAVTQQLTVTVAWADSPAISADDLGSTIGVWASSACAGPASASYFAGPDASRFTVLGLSAYRTYGFAVTEETSTGASTRSECSSVEVYPVEDIMHAARSPGLPPTATSVVGMWGLSVTGLSVALGGTVGVVQYLRWRRR